MLSQFLLYSQVNQLYIYLLFFRFLSHIGYYKVLSRVPCAIQQVLISYLFYIQWCVHGNPHLPIYPSCFLFPACNHTFVFYCQFNKTYFLEAYHMSISTVLFQLLIIIHYTCGLPSPSAVRFTQYIYLHWIPGQCFIYNFFSEFEHIQHSDLINFKLTDLN